jgi:hypothetical protein
MVVALGALQIDAEEDPADFTRQQVRLDVPFQVEAGSGPVLLLGSVGSQDLGSQCVERGVFLKRFAEILPELLSLDVRPATALHEHQLEGDRHVTGKLRASEEFIDFALPFVGSLVGEEIPEFVDGGDASGQIEHHPSEELGIVGRCRGRAGLARFQQRIDPLMQRRCSLLLVRHQGSERESRCTSGEDQQQERAVGHLATSGWAGFRAEAGTEPKFMWRAYCINKSQYITGLGPPSIENVLIRTDPQ